MSRRVDYKDQALADLIDSLEGHPLMMRVILPRLAQQDAHTLRQALDRHAPDAESPAPEERKLYATLRFIEDAFPPSLKPILYPIGLHESYVDAGHLAAIALRIQSSYTLEQVAKTLQHLESAGLVQRTFH
jgi:hypothetical protein